MNLYFRVLIFFLRIPFIQKSRTLKVWRKKFVAMPSDCDPNIHLTNSRYFSFADLARFYATAEMGLMGALYRRKWFAVVNASEIVFIRPILPLQTFEVSTEMIYWDEKYYYMEHQYKVKNKLCATAMIRGTFLHGKKVVPCHKVMELGGFNPDSPVMPEKVRVWKEMLMTKKNSTVLV